MIRKHPLLAAFVALYMVGFTARAVLVGNYEFLFYAAVMVVLAGGVMAMNARVRFSTLVLWLLAAWGFLHMAGGNVPIPASLAPDWTPPSPGARTVLYNMRPAAWMPKYDQIVHAFGFFSATLACAEALAAAVPGLRLSLGVRIAIFCMGMGLGAANEVVEFVATRFMETNVGDFVNTGWDLVSNMTGATIAAIVAGRIGKPLG
ncbi:MAG: DUF2238 domain-containing protein, partial [Phycisphaerales bacterium]